MTSEDVLNELERNGVTSVDIDLPLKAMAVKGTGGTNVMMYNSKLLGTEEERMIAMYHELCHIKYGLEYPNNAEQSLIDRFEYKANKRMYNELIPFKKLKTMWKQGCTLSEIAEHFNVPITAIMSADFLYTNIENYAEVDEYERINL